MALPQADSRLDVTDFGASNSAVYQLARNPVCVICSSSNQSIPTGNSVTKLTLDTAIYNPSSMFDSANNRISIVTAGYYVFVGLVRFAANVTGHRGMLFNAGGTFTGGSWVGANTTAGEETHIVGMSPIMNMSAGSFVELHARQGSGGNLNVLGNGRDTAFLSAACLQIRPASFSIPAQLNARGDASSIGTQLNAGLTTEYARVERPVGAYGLGFVEYSNVIEDTSSFFSAGQPSRLTVPSDGSYVVAFAGEIDGAAGNHDSSFQLYKNGSLVYEGNVRQQVLPTLWFLYTQSDCVAGDYFQVYINDSSSVASGQGISRFTIFKRLTTFLYT